MDDKTKEKLKGIIQKEIQLEDDMLGLYSIYLKKDSFLKKMDPNDWNITGEIINILLRGTARHKKMMEGIINSL